MNNKKKHGVKLRELDALGLSGVDMAQKIKGPAYRRDAERKKEALQAEEVAMECHRNVRSCRNFESHFLCGNKRTQNSKRASVKSMKRRLLL